MRILKLIQDAVLTAWVGGLWVVGYMVVPVLFYTLEKQQAGIVAGKLFANMYWMGMLASAVLFIVSWRRGIAHISRWFTGIVLAMLALTLVEMFVVHPMVGHVKQLIAAGDPQAQVRFSILHASGSIMYLILSLLGLGLLYTRPSLSVAGKTS